MNYKRNISKRIIEARNQAGLTQEEMGKALGLSGVGYGGFERGKTLPSIEHLIKISKLLHKPVTYFLDVDNPLADDEAELLEIYRQLPPAFKLAVLAAVKAVLSAAQAAPDGPKE